MTAMNTMPAASETWITDIGARASAAACRPQLSGRRSACPSANHFDEYRSLTAGRSGCSTPTLGAEMEPFDT